MPVTPIAAHCRRCSRPFHLYEIVDGRDGCCPRCNRILSDDWTAVLREEASRADVALRDLVGALRRLRTVPSNAAVSPQSIMRNLFEEVGWQRDIEHDRDRFTVEVDALQALLDDWERRVPNAARTKPSLWRRLTAPLRATSPGGPPTGRDLPGPARSGVSVILPPARRAADISVIERPRDLASERREEPVEVS
jgi:hypothetical protein